MKTNNKYLKFTSVAFQMIFIIAGGALLGRFLDGEEGNIYTIVLSSSGVVIGMYLVIKEALDMMKK